MSKSDNVKLLRELLRWSAPGATFCSTASLGFYLSSGSSIGAGLSGLVFLGSLALTITILPSPTPDQQHWISVLFWLHAMLSLAGAFCSGYWFTGTAFASVNHFYFWYAIVAGSLAMGVRYQKQWVPIGFMFFYISALVTSIGLVLYVLLFNGSMFKLFFAAAVLLIALPIYLVGRMVHWVLFKKDLSHRFAPKGIAQFSLESMFMWTTLLFLLLPANLNYIRWVIGWDS